MSIIHQSGREFLQLAGRGPVVGRGDHVLGRAAQPEQAILQVGELRGGQHDRVLGQSAALHGGAALVGPLPAGLRRPCRAAECRTNHSWMGTP